MFDINKPKEYFKDNLEIFILIPTILGGLWQLIELIRIDLSYVRFFSISQVISDGLLVLMFGLVFILLPRLVFAKASLEDSETSSGKIFIAFQIFYVLLWIWLLISTIKKIIENGFSTLTIIIFYVATILLFNSIYIVISRFFKIDRIVYLIIIGGIYLFFILYFIKNIFNIFHNLYHMPSEKELKNIEYLECYLNKKKNEFEFLYANDNYIFVEDNKTKQIEIVNFEELMNKENCKDNNDKR